jgi:type I restriction enzyme, R subunit
LSPTAPILSARPATNSSPIVRAAQADRFPKSINVQRLGPGGLDKSAQVVIATIQRAYFTLAVEELSEEEEKILSFELLRADPERLVSYNPSIPIESFDLVKTDECH